MGKALIIKGADFSANGFHYQTVRREITTLYDYTGNVKTTVADLPVSQAVYFYEDSSTHALAVGGSLGGAVSTSNGLGNRTYVEVEDYKKAIVTSRVSVGGSGVIGGLAVLFFLDENLNIVGGLSSGNSNTCRNVGLSNELRTFEVDIPATAKYAVATMMGNETIDLSNFKLVLEKQVISE